MKNPPGASLAFPAGWLGVMNPGGKPKHTDRGAPSGKACVSESAAKTTVHITPCMLATLRAELLFVYISTAKGDICYELALTACRNRIRV